MPCNRTPTRGVRRAQHGSRGSALSVHELVSRAARGEFPAWAVASLERREHMGRVADLLGSWAETLGLSADERTRWRSVGNLHDVVRDERADFLRERVPVAFRHFPDPLLHGPAASERLRVEGLLDGEILNAVAYHTVGDPAFGVLGRALYAADFLEAGRTFLPEWRADLRQRMPADLDDVVFAVVHARIGSLVEGRAPMHPQTIRFWNALVSERS